MTVTPTLLPVITNCFSTEILPAFFPEIINRIVDCYSLRCVFCYSVHSFGYPLFNFSLLSLRNELVAIEVKRWKGYLTERDDGFLQEKTDRWTGETHTKLLKSPFKQLGRAIYLLRKQIPIKAWVNAVVFFEDDELESVSAFSDNVWFDRYQDLVDYISNDGKVSFGTSANDFFERCVPADYLYANAWGKSLHCIINRTTLRFKTPQGDISADNIDSIRISHHWSYDELHITMADGSIKTITLENAKIQVSDNGRISTYALCKLDYIELGRTLNR